MQGRVIHPKHFHLDGDPLDRLMALDAQRDQVPLAVVVAQAKGNDVVYLQMATRATNGAERLGSQYLAANPSPTRSAATDTIWLTKPLLITSTTAEIAGRVCFS